MKKNLILVSLVLCLLFVSVLSASVPDVTYTPSLSIKKTNTPIKIDGKINDTEWSSASIVNSFIERDPGENIPPLVNTEAFVTYDENNLYVSFKCYDDPATIRASMTQRDQYSGNDEVGIVIDTYGDASVAYMLYVNPLGIQKDFLWNSITGGDSGYDLIWNASAEITDFGYEVEMAIPFSSLRFPNKEVQSWKIDFKRNHPRESYHQYAWAAYNRNEQCGPCQWGTVDGIASVKPGKGIEILPAYVGNQNHEFNGNDLHNFGFESEVGVTGKYSISSDIILEASLNPDFSQIEADAAQIDVNSTTSLFFNESRPFFQEGTDIFRTMFNSFYSRTIANPLVVSKLTGRPGSYRFGLISAYDDTSTYIIPLEENDISFKSSRSIVNSLRGLKSVGRNSRVGFMLNDRRYDGEEGSNTVFAVDVDFALTRSLRFDMQTIYAHTSEGTDASILGPDTINYFGDYTLNFDGESYGGIATISRIRYNSRNYFFQVGYNQLDPKYRTQTGFDPVNNHRSADFYTQYQFLPKEGLFERITPTFQGFNRWNMQTGEKRIENYNIGIESRLRYAQTFVRLSMDSNSEIYRGVSFDNMIVWNLNLNVQFRNNFGVYFNYSNGENIARGVNHLANSSFVNTGFEYKPFENLNIEPSIRISKGNDTQQPNIELFNQLIARTRVSWQINRKLSLRVVGELVDSKNSYNDNTDMPFDIANNKFLNVEPLVTYRLNPFTVFYLGMVNGYSEGDYDSDLVPYFGDSYDRREDQRKFFFKLQYLFQT